MKKYPNTKKGTALVLIILIVVFAIIDVVMFIFKYPETQEGMFWGIIGIEFTAIVGVMLFLMQLRDDSNINEIISYINDTIKKQDVHDTRSKSYLCSQIIENLNGFKNAYSVADVIK